MESTNHRTLTETENSRRKRKERETFYPEKPSPSLPRAAVTAATTSKGVEAISSKQLLAGYMAYEFLTKGTLLGNKFDPEARGAEPTNQIESYREVAVLMNKQGEGPLIPGIVNPTQLARWIQMKQI